MLFNISRIIFCTQFLLLCVALVKSEVKKTTTPKVPNDKPTRQGHLKPIGESGPMKKIDEAEGFIEPVKFYNNYLKKSRPVLMKNAAKSIPAFHLWTDNYLRSITPDGKEGDIEAEKGKKETRTGGNVNMNFKEFLDVYNTSDIYMVADAPQFLKPDLIIPWSIQCKEYKEILETTVVWFSSGGTKSVLHNDGFENINCLYRGSKRLVFIDINKYRKLETTILDVRNGGYSSMNVESVDLDRYPFMEKMEFYEGKMEAGDCIYIPLHWIHHVESFGSNLAVNIWWGTNEKGKVTSCNKKFDTALSLDRFHFQMVESKPHHGESNTKSKDGEYSNAPKSDDVILKIVLSNLDIVVYGEDKKYKEIFKGDFIEYFKQDLDKKKQCLQILEDIFNILDSNKDSILNKLDNYWSLNRKNQQSLIKLAKKYDQEVTPNNSGALQITLPFIKQNAQFGDEPPTQDKPTRSYIDQNVYADFSRIIVVDEL